MVLAVIFSKWLKKTGRYYRRLHKKFGSEDVHNFRLQIKRLRALMRLLNASLPAEKYLKIDRDVKLFYNITGRIRNLQLHRQRITYLCEDLFLEQPFTYLHILDDELATEKEKAVKQSTGISFRIFREDIAARVTGIGVHVTDFITLKIGQLKQILVQPVYSDEALHEVRKILKDILYNKRFLNTSDLPPSLSDFKFIDAFANKLGNFQDLCISGSFFKSNYMDQIEPGSEKKNLIAIMQQLEWSKGEMKDEIIDQLYKLRSELESC